ncbi:MAG: glycosyltransferase family 2 protein [Bacteroidales bacterium]|nr:glycosyltransferase family 2 protein [Bacteroidales bacterium]
MFSIIIPAFNEEDAIDSTIKQCKAIIEKCGDTQSEVIIVDDGSNDNTIENAKIAGAQVIRHPHNIGYGRSLKDGIMAAKNDIIIITDADGTYPIESIPELLSEYSKGFDMVVGTRSGKHYRESLFKTIHRRILKFLVEFTAGRKIPDINSGLRIFSKKTVTSYFNTLCDTFSFTTSLTLAYMMTGKFVKYIPIQYNKRIGKTKVRLFADSMRTLQFIVEAILYYNPIKIFLVFSMLLIFFAIISLTIAYFTFIKITYIFGIACLIASIFMFGMGLLSVQLKQIINRDK